MFIATRVVFDMETGECLLHEGYEYDGPLALCDRSAQSQAKNAGNSALGASNTYGANASAIGTSLTPELQSRATAPPGFGAALPGMMGEAAANAAAQAGKASQSARLRAMRTGNAAGQGAVDVGAAQAGGQNETNAIQGILGQNAMLENTQQQNALGALGNLYGQNVSGQLGGINAGVGAANAYTNAGKSGWLQNTMGVINSLKPGGSFKGMSFGG
ncbi:MAG: hypothetical protein ACRD22_01205 [Terriglobia bacterium]